MSLSKSNPDDDDVPPSWMDGEPDSLPIDAAMGYAWGACPECGGPMDFFLHNYVEDAGWLHWACCERDRVRWCAGMNLFSGPAWIAENEDATYEATSWLDVEPYREVESLGEIPAWALPLLAGPPPETW